MLFTSYKDILIIENRLSFLFLIIISTSSSVMGIIKRTILHAAVSSSSVGARLTATELICVRTNFSNNAKSAILGIQLLCQHIYDVSVIAERIRLHYETYLCIPDGAIRNICQNSLNSFYCFTLSLFFFPYIYLLLII